MQGVGVYSAETKGGWGGSLGVSVSVSVSMSQVVLDTAHGSVKSALVFFQAPGVDATEGLFTVCVGSRCCVHGGCGVRDAGVGAGAGAGTGAGTPVSSPICSCVGKFSVMDMAAALAWLRRNATAMCRLGKSIHLSTTTTRRRRALVFFVETCEAREMEGAYMCTDGEQEDALGEGLRLGGPQLDDLKAVLSRGDFEQPMFAPSSDETVAWLLQVAWGAYKGDLVF